LSCLENNDKKEAYNWSRPIHHVRSTYQAHVSINVTPKNIFNAQLVAPVLGWEIHKYRRAPANAVGIALGQLPEHHENSKNKYSC
jgi:hypothetical protein